MRVLLLSHKFYPEIGGIEATSEMLADYFSKAGMEVRLLTWSKGKGEKSFPYEVIRNPNRLRVFKEHLRADLIFENNPSLKLSWPLIFMNKPHIITVHTWVSRADGRLGFKDRLKRKWLKTADEVIAVSNSLKDSLNLRSQVIQNSYNEELFRTISEINRDRDFVFLGRLVSDKGADMAIMLIKMLNSGMGETGKPCDYNLTIIGDGPERKKLEDLVRKNRLENLVKFTGSLSGEKLAETLNSHKYIVVPSRWEEPFGMVALEGMACGCLPIVSNGGGLPEAVGDAGLIFKRNDQSSLFDKVRGLLADPVLESKLKSNVNAHLAKHASTVVFEKYLETLRNVYEKYYGKEQVDSVASNR